LWAAADVDAVAAKDEDEAVVDGKAGDGACAGDIPGERPVASKGRAGGAPVGEAGRGADRPRWAMP